MELSRKDIHTSSLMSSKYSQITIDDDFNIPDMKEDIDRIIAKNGHIVVEEVKPEEGRVRVLGSVCFTVLYKTASERPDIEVYEGEIPFENHINVDGTTHMHTAYCRCDLEDITISMINSRKLEVRGLIGNDVSVYEDKRISAAFDLENGQGIECRYKNLVITETMISKHDVFKLREEIDIPQNKPNIKDIMWSSVELKNIETRAADDKIYVRGEVEIFAIYRGQEEHLPIQYLFSARTISKEIECMGANENMILEAELRLGKGDITVKPDEDGEDRIIGVDYNVDMEIRMYEDNELKLLSDMYSPHLEIIPDTESFTYENLLMRNLAKAKISHRRRISDDDAKLLQICHIYGDVEIDDTDIKNGMITVSGVVRTNILYISADDEPMNCMETDIPFTYDVETLTLKSDDVVRIVPCIDQLSATLLNSEEVEIKAQVNLGISVFSHMTTDVMTDMKVADINYEKKASMPGIVGYIVKSGDTLWSVARRYYATTDSIRELNRLESDNIKEGDRLIIVKS